MSQITLPSPRVLKSILYICVFIPVLQAALKLQQSSLQMGKMWGFPSVPNFKLDPTAYLPVVFDYLNRHTGHTRPFHEETLCLVVSPTCLKQLMPALVVLVCEMVIEPFQPLQLKTGRCSRQGNNPLPKSSPILACGKHIHFLNGSPAFRFALTSDCPSNLASKPERSPCSKPVTFAVVGVPVSPPFH